MNTEEYLKSLLGENSDPNPAEPEGRPVVGEPDLDPRIAAALKEQEDTFNKKLKARDDELAELRGTVAGPDEETHMLVNGKWQELPADEDGWQTLLNNARRVVNDQEDDETRETLDRLREQLQGRYYRWQGREGARSVLPTPPEADPENDPEPDSPITDEIDAILTAAGLDEGTKGRAAVEILMANGKSLKDALDMIGADEPIGRVGPTGEERIAAHQRASALPDNPHRDMAPPEDVVNHHRKPKGREGVARDMNAALARQYAGKKRPQGARTFRRR
jgi:hypothetical protein